jgi:hypothetical protein
MMNRTTSFVVGALTCTIAGASFVTMHLGDAGAAAECLAAPNKGAPAGQHWFYRIDRATQHHCWYLGDEGKTVSRAAKPTSERRTTLTESDRGAALARSAANVHAEMPMPQIGRDDDAKAAAAAPVVQAAPDSASPAQGAPRDVASEPQKSSDIWHALDAQNFQPAASEPPKQVSSAATAVVADATADATVDPGAPAAPTAATAPPSAIAAAPALAPAPAVVMLPLPVTRMEPSAMGRATSLSALFVAAFGALVFVTLAMGLSYFFRDRGVRLSDPADRVFHDEDWPPEPFRLPSSLKLLAHGSFTDELVEEAVPALSGARRSDMLHASAPASGPRDGDVRQIEQLLTRAVRRSESLRGHIEDYASRSSA